MGKIAPKKPFVNYKIDKITDIKNLYSVIILTN